MRAWPLALLILVSACNGSPTTTTPPVSTPTAPRTIVTTHSPLPLPKIEGKPTTFKTSDGNVACDLESAYARCDVKSHTWPAPKKPSDCHNKWGSEIAFAIGSKATFICWFGKSPAGTKRVLPAGQAITVGLVTCRATATSVSCTGQGNGFTVGRKSYRLF